MFGLGVIVGVILFPTLIILMVKAVYPPDPLPLPPPPKIEKHYHYHADRQPPPVQWQMLEDQKVKAYIEEVKPPKGKKKKGKKSK